MQNLILPDHYDPKLSVRETQEAILIIWLRKMLRKTVRM